MRLKVPTKRRRAITLEWMKKNKQVLLMGVIAILIIAMAVFVTASCVAKTERKQADQAAKRLSELTDQHEQDQIKWEIEKEIEIEMRIEQARMEAQAEMAGQIAELNKRIEDENQAYKDLEKSLDDLRDTYQELMDTVFGPTGVILDAPMMTEPIFATASLAGEWYDKYFPKGLDPLIDIYLGWKEKYPEGYANLVKWGRAFTMGDTANYPPLALDPAMFESCILAYDGARVDGFLHMYNRTASPYYGRGVELVRYLRNLDFPRDWYSCLAIMELESTCGMASGENDMGILDEDFSPGTVWQWEGYLRKWQTKTFHCLSNDLTMIAQVYNDHTDWRNNFYELAGNLRDWYP